MSCLYAFFNEALALVLLVSNSLAICLNSMANILRKILNRSFSLDVIPLSKILLFKDLLNQEVERNSFEEQEINELW